MNWGRVPWVSVVLFLAACADPSTDYTEVSYRIPTMASSGHVDWQAFKVSSSDPYRLKSEHVEVFVDASVASSGQGFAGTPARVQLLEEESGQFVPTTPQGILAVSAFVHMSQILEWEQSFLAPDYPLSLPRSVGVELNWQVVHRESVWTENNAFYAPSEDLISVLPTKSQELPFAMNGGILAHEHFHALFHELFRRPLLRELETITSVKLRDPTDLDGQETVPERLKVNLLLLRAWNEGLADLWGALYSDDPDFLRKSFKSSSHSHRRSLSKAPVPSWSRAQYKKRLRLLWQNRCPSKGCGLYALGTNQARILYGLYQKLNLTKNQFATVLMSTLRSLNDEVTAQSFLATSYEPDFLIRQFVSQLPENVRISDYQTFLFKTNERASNSDLANRRH